MIPPVALPAAQIPMARLFFLEKYVEIKATDGQKIKPFPRPQQTPCARKICRYVVLREVMKRPIVPKSDPTMNTGRKYPASVKRPDRVPMKKRQKIWTEPIQEMSEGARFRVVT
jgi:hypothetical protein